MKLLQAALNQAVGGTTKTETYSRLGCGLALALLAGWSMGAIAHRLNLGALPHAGRLYFSVIFIFQLIGWFAFITASLYSRPATIARIALTLPLSNWRIGLTHLLPVGILATLFIVACLPPFYVLFCQLGLHGGYVIVCCLFGTFLSLSLGYIPFHLPFVRFAVMFCIVATEYLALHSVQQHLLDNSLISHIAMIVLILLYATTLCLAVVAIRHCPTRIVQTATTHPVHSILPTAWWFIVCGYRNAALRINILVTSAMSLVVIVAIRYYHVPTTIAPPLIALWSAVLAVDIRGLVRLNTPAEIAALNGAPTMIRRTFGSSLIWSSLATLPFILLCLFAHQRLSVDTIICSLLVGAFIGNGLGHIFASSCKNILVPFAALCATYFIVSVVPAKMALTSLSWWWQDMFYLGIAIICRWLAEYVEYKRNSFTWRSTHE